MSKFKEGDIVKLKSGGPKMTYTGRKSSNYKNKAECLWFADNKLESGWFPPNSLILADEDTDSLEIETKIWTDKNGVKRGKDII